MILVTGAGGFVGGKIMQMRTDAIACPSLRGLGEEDIKRIIDAYDVDAVIHTAAISDVGACQRDPDASYEANVMLPVHLARVVKNKDIKLVCFSSDQVYTGAKETGPYSEDMACPANVYAEHKLEMEQRVLDILPDTVHLRAEWMYDYYLKKSNYYMNVINAGDTLRFSSSVYRGITYVKEVGENMDSVMRLPGGVYNFGSETTKSMYEITRAFLKVLGKNIALEDCPAGHNLWMNCAKARQYGVDFSSVEEGLKQCAADYGSLSG
jgi:dTDP-4-dehydrorhamnose reductase